MNTRRFRMLVIFFLVMATRSFGQSAATCDIVYDIVETNATYGQGMQDMSNYLWTQITPIISRSITDKEILPTRLYITLTIDVEGKVTAATLSHHSLPENCQEKIIEKLKTMTGWTPGRINGQAVCSKFVWAISCIKWG